MLMVCIYTTSSSGQLWEKHHLEALGTWQSQPVASSSNGAGAGTGDGTSARGDTTTSSEGPGSNMGSAACGVDGDDVSTSVLIWLSQMVMLERLILV